MEIQSLKFEDRDEFKRKGIAIKAISLLQAEIDVSPMVIDGSWGTGKTEFCHKLINLMQGYDSYHLIYIDAFKADHADEPLMTVLAEVIKVLPDENSKQSFIKKALPTVRYGLKTFAKAGVSHLLRQDIADFADDFDKEIQKTADKVIDATVETVLKDHVKADKNLKALQAALKEITAVKPIVLFVDELDRCRPNFAVDMLEIIKHTFDVVGVKFVLITNTQQLKASINHCYGQSVDAQRYLDKFVKFTIALPETVDTNAHRESIAAIEHYKNLVRTSLILKDLELFECGSIRTIKKIVIVNKLSLREIETIVRHLEIYVTLSSGKNLQTNTIFGYKILTVLAITIYSIQPEVALSILQKRVDSKDIGDFLGVSTLSTDIKGYRDEQELICYMLGHTALFHKEKFTPTEDLEVWKERCEQYFRGGFWHTDDYASICSDAIQTLAMC